MTERLSPLGADPLDPSAETAETAPLAETAESTVDTVPLAPPAGAVAPAEPAAVFRPAAADTPVRETTVAAAATALPGPRIRWAGIVWGLVLAAVAASALWLLTAPERYAPLRAWMLGLTPDAFPPGLVVGVAVAVVGVLLLIVGAVALLRRAHVRASIAP